MKITNCLSTHNNLNYLKLAVKSVRENEYFKDSKLLIHAENCVDGTNDWLNESSSKYRFEYIIEQNEIPKGIGGGMNVCAANVTTELINFLHSDFYVSKNWDLELYKHFENGEKKRWVFSQRIQPNIFHEQSRPGTIIVPTDMFGEYHHNFNEKYFLEWCEEFKKLNDFTIRLGEGVSGMIRKDDWDYIGGNDPLFSPASWEDKDIFLRMQLEKYDFILTSKSVIYHFGARGSHFPTDDLMQSSERQKQSELNNGRKWFKKWGFWPSFDQFDFIKVPEEIRGKYNGQYMYNK